MMYEWDENKRQANIRKHGIDLARDGVDIYESPGKFTFASHRPGEQRWCDVALLNGSLMTLTLTYTLRGTETVRFISLRPASRKERRLYHGQNR